MPRETIRSMAAVSSWVQASSKPPESINNSAAYRQGESINSFFGSATGDAAGPVTVAHGTGIPAGIEMALPMSCWRRESAGRCQGKGRRLRNGLVFHDLSADGQAVGSDMESSSRNKDLAPCLVRRQHCAADGPSPSASKPQTGWGGRIRREIKGSQQTAGLTGMMNENVGMSSTGYSSPVGDQLDMCMKKPLTTPQINVTKKGGFHELHPNVEKILLISRRRSLCRPDRNRVDAR